MAALPSPNEPLEAEQMSLKQFVELAYGYIREGDVNDVLSFVLAGRMPPANPGQPQRRVYVNALQEAMLRSIADVTLHRDYDSLIAITEDLPFKTHMAIYPIPCHKDTLTTSNHMTYNVTLSNGRRKKVPLHQIPNCGFGKVEARHITRLFFPALWETQHSRGLTQAQLTTLYDRCVQPTVYEIFENVQEHWPPSYATAYQLQRDEFGKLHFHTVDAKHQCLQQFSTALRARLNNVEIFRGSFYLHEFRGLKGTSHHDPRRPAEITIAYRNVMQHIDVDRINLEQWFIDVGIEINRPETVLQWRKSAHPSILKFVLPHVDDAHITALLASSSRFNLDISAHHGDLAGFRCEPRSDGVRDQVSYINVYTTDKEGSYQLHKGLFTRRPTSAVLPAFMEKLMKDVESMAGQVAQYSQEESRHEGNCRLEVRVPLSIHSTTLTTFPPRLALNGMARYHYTTWWMLKFHRLTAIAWALRHIRDSPPEVRAWRSSLILASCCIYMLNAIFVRPADNSRSKELSRACTLHTARDAALADEEFDRDNLVPVEYAQGLYFVSQILMEQDKWPRLNAFVTMDDDHLYGLYGSDKESILQLFLPALFRNADTNPGRIHNRRSRMTTDVALFRDNDDYNGPDFEIPNRVIALAPKIRMTGPDAEEFAALTLDDPEDENMTVAQAMRKIWQQLPLDIVTLSPNKGGRRNGSYILLPKQEMELVTMDLFLSNDFTPLFERIRYKVLSKDEWQRFVFDKFFPNPDDVRHVPHAQNFKKCKYLTEWFSQATQLSRRDLQAVRRLLWDEFQKLVWLPYPASDRMWNTKRTTTAGFVTLPEGDELCPQIAVYGAHRKVPNIDPQPEIAVEEVNAAEE